MGKTKWNNYNRHRQYDLYHLWTKTITLYTNMLRKKMVI